MKGKSWIPIVGLATAAGAVWAYFRYGDPAHSRSRTPYVIRFIQNPSQYADWMIAAGVHCNSAHFAFPTDGMIGYLWGDTFQMGHRHQGIDIFGGTEPGVTPIYAAYDGFLTRQADWKSAVIIRIPSDPLHPGTQIWAYYAHMADPDGNSFIAVDFPAGTNEKPVSTGTLLGYMGNYSGNPGQPVGVHLHFSVVKDDGTGHFTNELKIENTLDPSPYLRLPLNAATQPAMPVLCSTSSH